MVSLSLDWLSATTFIRHGVTLRVHDHLDVLEVPSAFLARDSDRLLPVMIDGELRILQWGNRGSRFRPLHSALNRGLPLPFCSDSSSFVTTETSRPIMYSKSTKSRSCSVTAASMLWRSSSSGVMCSSRMDLRLARAAISNCAY